MLCHSLHPHDPLHEVYIAEEFVCDGCNALGHGKRYHCSACTFDLHERCATCPLTLPSHLHPAHPLALVNQSLGMVCNLCGEAVNGLYYTCRACWFNVHPLCTELPALVEHAAHPHHILTLRPAEPRNCSVCWHVCSSWRYTCEPCRVDLHLECAFQEPVADYQIVTTPVSTYDQRQYGYVAGVPSAPVSKYDQRQYGYVAPVSTYDQRQYGYVAGVPSAPVSKYDQRQYGYVAPVSTYDQRQYGYVAGAPSASPYYFYPYQPVVYQPIYSAMPINGGASKSTSGSSKRKRIYLILAKVATKVVIGSITGGFSC